MRRARLKTIKEIKIIEGKEWSHKQGCWLSSYYKYDSSNNWIPVFGEELKRIKLQLHLLGK